MNGTPISAGDAISRGWQAFSDRLGDFVIIAVVAAVINWILYLILDFVAFPGVDLNRLAIENSGVSGIYWFAVAAISLAQLVVFAIAAVFWTSTALAGVDGEQVELGELGSRSMDRFWPFVGWNILYALATFVGFFFCIIGLFVAWFFLIFVPFFAYAPKQGLNPFTGSGKVAIKFPGQVIVMMLFGVALAIGLGIIRWIFGFLPFVGFLVSAVATFIVWGFWWCSLASLFRMTESGLDDPAVPPTSTPPAPGTPPGTPPAPPGYDTPGG